MILVGFSREEVVFLKLYREKSLIIAGDKAGGLVFWSFSGQIIKKMQPFKSPIGNMIICRRSNELDFKNSLIHRKKSLSFKPLKKK